MAKPTFFHGAIGSLSNSNPPRQAGQFIMAQEGSGSGAKLRLFYDFSDLDRREVANFDQIASYVASSDVMTNAIENVITGYDFEDTLSGINSRIDDIANAVAARISAMTGADASVVITGSWPNTTRTIRVNISPDAGNTLQLRGNGLYVPQPTPQGTTQSGDTVIKATQSGANTTLEVNIATTDSVLTKEATGLKVNLDLDYDTITGELFITGKTVAGTPVKQGTGVLLPLDSFLQHAAVITVPPQPAAQTYTIGGNTHNYPAPATPLAAGKYLAMVFINKEGNAIATYVNVQELVDVYTAGNGISISGGNQISINIQSGSHLVATGSGLGIESGWTLVSTTQRSWIDSALQGISVPDEGVLLKDALRYSHIPRASDSKFGVAKLYNEMGVNTDGAITQAAVNAQLTIQSF